MYGETWMRMMINMTFPLITDLNGMEGQLK